MVQGIPTKLPKIARKGLNLCTLHRANGHGRFGGQTAGGHPKAFPWPQKPLFAVPALRELESACRVSILRDAVTVCFLGTFGGFPEGSAAVRDPNPPRPFARYRNCYTLKWLGVCTLERS